MFKDFVKKRRRTRLVRRGFYAKYRNTMTCISSSPATVVFRIIQAEINAKDKISGMEFQKLSDHIEEKKTPPKLPTYETKEERDQRVLEKKVKYQARKIAKVKRGFKEKLWYFLLTPIFNPGLRTIYFYCVEFQSCLIAGIPIVEAFKVMAQTAGHRKLQKSSQHVFEELDKGKNIEEALSDKKLCFPRFFKVILISGVKSGSLVNNLKYLIEHYSLVMVIKSVILRVIWYPIAQLILGSLILSALFIILDSMKNGFQWIPALLILWRFLSYDVLGFGIGVMLAEGLKRSSFRSVTDQIMLMIPIFGAKYRQYKLAIFFKVFASMIDAGGGVLYGYKYALDAMNSPYLEGRLKITEKFMRDGETMYNAFKISGIFNKLELSMIASAEASGSHFEMLNRIAQYYIDDVKIILPGLIKMCAPFIPIIVGLAFFVNPVFFIIGIGFLVFLFHSTS